MRARRAGLEREERERKEEAGETWRWDRLNNKSWVFWGNHLTSYGERLAGLHVSCTLDYPNDMGGNMF